MWTAKNRAISGTLLDKKCEELLDTLRNVPTNLVLRLFKDVSNNIDGLPEDREILKYYRAHLALKEEPSNYLRIETADTGYFRDMQEKYPKFKDFLGLAIERPNDFMPDDAKKVFWTMLQDPKNFNHIPDTSKKVHE